MTAYPLTSLITLLTVLLMFITSVIVGKARVTYEIMAPATSGHEMFDRAYRVQMNTMEAAAMMLPSLWIYAIFNGETGAFAMGVIWLLGRAWYAQAYLANPVRRGRTRSTRTQWSSVTSPARFGSKVTPEIRGRIPA